jgi:hypothetical protein
MSGSGLTHRSPSGLEAGGSKESHNSAKRRVPISLGVASRRDVQFCLLLNIRYPFRTAVKRNLKGGRGNLRAPIARRTVAEEIKVATVAVQ